MFQQGDIILASTLNTIDGYIKELYDTLGDNETVQALYATWTGIPTDEGANSINDEIAAIKEK